MRRAIALALLACGCSHAAAKAPEIAPPANERETQADFATKLFMQACVANLTKPGDLSQWIETQGLHRAPTELEAKILAGQTGEVWSASSSLGAFFLILVPIDQLNVNQCSVWARRADAARLTEHFERLLLGSARPGLEVERVSDDPVQGPGGDYRQLVYYVHEEGQELGWVFVATTSPSEQAEIQGRLMASPGQGSKIVSPGGTPTPEKP
jgi:hypothetical protein